MRDAMRMMGLAISNAATAAIQAGLSDLRRKLGPRATCPPNCAGGDTSTRTIASSPTRPESGVGGRRASDPRSRPVAQTMRRARSHRLQERATISSMHRPASPLRPSPLLLMLHGCTQDAARLRPWNTDASARCRAKTMSSCIRFSAPRSNANGCWNWFRTADQQRGMRRAGAPGRTRRGDGTAAIRCDPRRVYVAGLSAGGAMAVTLGRVYPDVFRRRRRAFRPSACVRPRCRYRAGGNAQGRKAGVSRPQRTKGAALQYRRSSSTAIATPRSTSAMPRRSWRTPWDSPRDMARPGDGRRRLRRDASPAGTRSPPRAPGTPRGSCGWSPGSSMAAGHAWFGGSPGGTFTDPKGPDATAEMLRFFRSVA